MFNVSETVQDRVIVTMLYRITKFGVLLYVYVLFFLCNYSTTISATISAAISAEFNRRELCERASCLPTVLDLRIKDLLQCFL